MPANSIVKVNLGTPYELTSPINPDFARTFANKVHAGFQLIGISSREESRLERSIYNVCHGIKTSVIMWDIANGFSQPPLQVPTDPRKDRTNFKLLEDSKYCDPLEAVRATSPEGLVHHTENKQLVFIFRDFHHYLEDPVVRRALRSMFMINALSCPEHFRPIVMISPDLVLHHEIRDCVTRVQFPLPDTNELNNTVEMVWTGTKSNNPDLKPISDSLRDGLLSDMRGMTGVEAENALAEAVVDARSFKPEMRIVLKRSKADAVEMTGALKYVDPAKLPKPDDIGGFEVAKAYVRRRALAYSKEAEALNLDYPKGIALVGVPGSGKTEFAKMVASQTGLPLYLLDISAVFKSHIGESEATMRMIQEIVTAQQGCVLVCNEIDKAFAHAHDSQGDSGVTARVFGQFLDWRSESRDRTFMVYTMNRVTTLPPELLRKGRVDKIFSADLPNATVRHKIFDIHMTRRDVSFAKAKLSDTDIAQLVTGMDNLTGSEIEEVVIEAMFHAYERSGKKHKVPTMDMFVEAVAEIHRDSLMVVDPKGVQSIRDWCSSRAVPVDEPDATETSVRGTGRGVKIQPGSN